MWLFVVVVDCAGIDTGMGAGFSGVGWECTWDDCWVSQCTFTPPPEASTAWTTCRTKQANASEDNFLRSVQWWVDQWQNEFGVGWMDQSAPKVEKNELLTERQSRIPNHRAGENGHSMIGLMVKSVAEQHVSMGQQTNEVDDQGT